MRKTRNIVAGTILAQVVVVLGAWLARASWLPHAIAQAPNAGKTFEALARNAPHADGARELRVEVGPPAASLSIAVLDPPSYPRATIFVLHGIRDRKTSMMGFGRSLSNAGYRAVLVDLRGHGQSTGEWLSFGDREGRDLMQVADLLATRGLLALPLGVYGPSYGGAAGLQLARRDPRVRAVVTVATFTRMKDIVPLYGERVVPTWFVTRSDMFRAIDRAGVLGAFDPDGSDSVAAIAATKAHVLLFHGRADANIPWQHAESLHGAAPDHSTLRLIDGRDHSTIMSDETVMQESLAWFARWVAEP
ncbi:MAG TPA: alpha/beta fold hydrolase [Labilithrix sp.]|nr:alpha/beta fold hydrolase [Labilithrix sp.]